MNSTKERIDGDHLIQRPRSRFAIIIAGVAIIVVAILVWALIANRGESRREGPAGAGADMAGMAGMDMSAGGSVHLTASQLRQFGITFGTVEVRPLTSEVRAAGVVTADETKIAQVASRVDGFIERLYVDFTGEAVRRGQPLLEIFSPELVAAQQELLLAVELQRNIGAGNVPGVPEGSNLVEAAKRRLRSWEISDAQIDELLRSGRVRRTLAVHSPTAGVVLEKKVVQGQAIAAGDPLYTIADLSGLWIDVQLREADASSVRVGSGVDVELAGLAGRTFKGRVEYVYPALNEETRAVRARVVVGNAGGVLKPGMYATVRVTTPGRSALTVPTSAVLRTGERNVVFVDMGAGELMPHEVELGRAAGDHTEVLSGVDAGQRVVTSAQFLLDSESNVGEVMKAMVGQMGAGSSRDDMRGMDMPGMDGKGADMKNVPATPPRPAAPPPRR